MNRSEGKGKGGKGKGGKGKGGKGGEEEAAPKKSKFTGRRGGGEEISSIGNKQKRAAMYEQSKSQAKREHAKERKKRKRDAELLGPDAPAKPVARTLDNQREADDTMLEADDEEVTDSTIDGRPI